MQKNKQEKSPIKKRILQYLEIKGITKYAFYKQSGVSRGILDQDTGITEENLSRFLAYAQDISLVWLLSGEGEIFITKGTEYPVNLNDRNIDRINDRKQKVQNIRSNMEEPVREISKTKSTEKVIKQNDDKVDDLNDDNRKVQKKSSNFLIEPVPHYLADGMYTADDLADEEESFKEMGIDPDDTQNFLTGWTNRQIYRWIVHQKKEFAMELYTSGDAFPAEIVQQLLDRRDQALIDQAVERMRTEFNQNETRPK